jgi:hypothetical protein
MAAAQKVGFKTTLYVGALDWWLNCVDSERGIHAQNYERFGSGGTANNPLNTPPWDARHFEVGAGHAGSISRDRMIRRYWLALAPDKRQVLRAHYAHGRWPLGADVLSIHTRNSGGDREGATMPGAALFLATSAGTLGEVLDACQRRPGASVVTVAREAAIDAVVTAHTAYARIEAAESEDWLGA